MKESGSTAVYICVEKFQRPWNETQCPSDKQLIRKKMVSLGMRFVFRKIKDKSCTEDIKPFVCIASL